MGHFIACDTTIDAEGTAELFRKHIWKLHGTPQHTVSDQGSIFNSKFLHRLYEILGIKPHLSTAFHPQTEGQTKRVNQNLEQYLRLYTTYMQDDWATMLDIAEFQYNNNVHSSTGMTPFFANYGFHPCISPSAIEKTTVPVAEEITMKLNDISNELKAMIKLSTD